MLTLLFRKMRNTKWMVICLLVGFVMASAMMSTIPIYMNASLQRMLVKDMEAFQLENNVYPGLYAAQRKTANLSGGKSQRDYINDFESNILSNYNKLGIPMLNRKTVALDAYLYVSSIKATAGTSTSRITVGGMSYIDQHVDITEGRMFNPGMRDDGVMEAITTAQSLKISRLTVGTVYEIENVFGGMPSTKVEIVGVFEPKDEADAYWSENIDTDYVATLFLDYDTFLNDGLDTGAFSVSSIRERISMDYPNMDMTDLAGVNKLLQDTNDLYKEAGISLSVPAKTIFEDYADRASQLRLILWLLQIPVMLMIVFYLYMVSQLNVEQEKNEIAVFKSRGASSLQIMTIYALESIVLGIATSIIGPFVGLGLCQILGASNGFLEFVNRKALPVRLSLTAFTYALIAAGVFFVTTMIPIFPATKVTIVAHKQSKAKKNKKPLWEKMFLDVILLAGSVAWLYYYNRTQQDLISEGVDNTLATVNPLLFVASTTFILGAGLLVVRIYPLVVRGVYAVGKRFWSPSAYVSLNNIGRSSTGREKFIMTFLILTVSLGLFFANTARALNRNAEDRVNYSVGADVVMNETWYSSELDNVSGPSGPTTGPTYGTQEETEDEPEADASEFYYIEPSIERFEELAGVEKVTSVFDRDGVTIFGDTIKKQVRQQDNNDDRGGRDWEEMADSRSQDRVTEARLMTVIPGEFSEICWFRNDLLPTHINNYLNALAEFPSGVILSGEFEDYGVELGDKVTVSWGKNAGVEATVVAFADFWPGINPYEKTKSGEYKCFAVMNFDYVRIQSAVEPYQVWMKLKDGASVQQLYDSIEDSDIEVENISVASQQIISEKNDPMLQGMNGALTLGFIIIMIMCIIGFLIYWILSIKSRTLQFGILRAMGMSYGEIIAMIVYEQLLVSGVAIAAAVVIGGIASDLFVPLFQSLYSTVDRVPGFIVQPLRSDYLKVYLIVAIMLVIGFAVLGRIISKIKISQALKLGED